MKRPPTPAPHPPLLALALRLAPEAQRSWVEDMADELRHVPPENRGAWQRGAVALALRWRLASVRTVPRPQLAVAVLTAALLVGSPWLLRRYALQTQTAVVVSESDVGAASADEARRDAAAQRSDEAPSVDALAAPTLAGEPAADADALADSAEPFADVAEAQLQEGAAPAPVAAAVGDPEAPSEGAALSAAESETARERLETDRDGLATVRVVGATVQLTALRATELQIRAGLADDVAPLLDRRVAAGERFLLTLPSLVIADDGGALEAGALGALGHDGVPLRLGFVADEGDGEPPPP